MDNCRQFRTIRDKGEGRLPRIVVTGGAGFIGSALVRHLVSTGLAEVVNFDKLTYAGCLESLRDVAGSTICHFLQADICDRDAVTALLEEFRPDSIIHLAAETHVDRSIDDPLCFVKTNVLGTANLLQCALEYWQGLDEEGRRSFRFQHVSTDEVYGALGKDGLFRENTPYDPSSPYSASKASSDHMVRAWWRTYGLPVLVSNCSNNYGPFQFPEKLIPLAIINALEGRPLPVYGKGENIRDWLYVEDHVRALWLINRKGVPGETYNIGGNSERSNLQVVTAICRILDELAPCTDGGRHERLVKFVEDRPGHDLRYAIDASKIANALGWKPEVNFEEGLLKTVRWYMDNSWWWKPIREGRYGGDRLGRLDKRY